MKRRAVVTGSVDLQIRLSTIRHDDHCACFLHRAFFDRFPHVADSGVAANCPYSYIFVSRYAAQPFVVMLFLLHHDMNKRRDVESLGGEEDVILACHRRNRWVTESEGDWGFLPRKPSMDSGGRGAEG